MINRSFRFGFALVPLDDSMPGRRLLVIMRALYRHLGEDMPHDIDRLDVHERQLLMGETQPRGSVWTDIGEAQVSHTIFGKARVRILHRQDAVRRAWRWTILGVAVTVGAVWLAWNVSQQPVIPPATSPVPGAAQVVPVPMTPPEPVREAEKLPTPAVKPGTVLPAEIAKLPVAQKPPANRDHPSRIPSTVWCPVWPSCPRGLPAARPSPRYCVIPSHRRQRTNRHPLLRCRTERVCHPNHFRTSARKDCNCTHESLSAAAL